MDNFTSRYDNLNDKQQLAVDTIDGPLLVVAGPGTGKTELLSMRVANILRKTDVLPSNILCLTFTDSGAVAMRKRLGEIIGPNAYKVAIQTFHSFGTDVINQNKEYFYRGAEFQPADDIASYEILTGIFDELDHNNPLISKNNGDYIYLSDTLTAIGELKKAGLSSDELFAIIDANDQVLDAIEPEVSTIFSARVNIGMLQILAPVAQKVAAMQPQKLPRGTTPLSQELALSLARAIDEASETNKTTAITAWKSAWLEKDASGTRAIFKDRKRHTKLRALAHVYFAYISRMEQAGLYDYNDMVLNVVHAMELYPDLKANLQERYQYILVDEFQDTNMSQLRILFNLTDNPVGDTPNIMAVGDDDQAIYSFQGADVNNINRFRTEYPAYTSIVLTENYRSQEPILTASREVIVQADGRLEVLMDISKKLEAKASKSKAYTVQISTPNQTDQYSQIAESIAQNIKDGVAPKDIAVLARKHNDLVELVPYLQHAGIAINYERRDNVLDMESVNTLILIAEMTVATFSGEHQLADSKLPELISHPMFKLSPEQIWRLSIQARGSELTWLETMLSIEALKPIADWLLDRARAVSHDTLETYIDSLVGAPEYTSETEFRSPFYEYYFNETVLEKAPDTYIMNLEALRTLRTKLREYMPGKSLHITDMLEFIITSRQLGTRITNIRSSSVGLENSINLLSAHKSKGLEFDTVYIINSIDKGWGEKARGNSPNISYPENLRIRPNANTYDERLRLYYVAMTRAKRQLYICYSREDAVGKELLPAGFLTNVSIDTQNLKPERNVSELVTLNKIAWQDRIVADPTVTMKELLAPMFESYKLSATHLNAFIDLTHGGPTTFLMNNLLRFPQAKSASASYGTAIHNALQRAHNHLSSTGERRPIEDLLGDFVHELEKQRLSEKDFELYSKKGSEHLAAFLAAKYDSFAVSQRTELSFANQGVALGEARLTGSLDLVDFDGHDITVTDYKTGRPSSTWKGTSDYDKVRLHKYRQQLMFYQLLCENSRDFAKYNFTGGVLQFVEHDDSGAIYALDDTFTSEDLERFTRLVCAVWQCITTLELPDVHEFGTTHKDVLAFEEFLIDKYA